MTLFINYFLVLGFAFVLASGLFIFFKSIKLI